MMYDHPMIENFVVKHMVTDDGRFKIHYKGKKYSIPNSDHYLERLSHDRVFVTKIINRFPKLQMEHKASRHFSFINLNLDWQDGKMDDVVNLIWLCRANPNIIKLAIKNPNIKKFNESIDDIVNKLLSITHESSDEEINFAERALVDFGNSYDWALRFHPKQTKIRKQILQHFYHDFLPGGSYKNLDKKVKDFQGILPWAIKFGVDQNNNPR